VPPIEYIGGVLRPPPQALIATISDRDDINLATDRGERD
jgi:hypothetical protein